MVKKEIITKSDVMAKSSDFYALLNPEERKEFLKETVIELYRHNEMIYEEGEVPTHLLFLYSGKAKVFKNGISNRTQIVRLVNAGDYFGFRDHFANQNYVTSSATFEPSIICKIPMATVNRWVQENPQIGLFFIKKMAGIIGQSDERTVNLTQKHVRGRLAEALLLLKNTYGVDHVGSTLTIYPSREDLANISNMTTANAIRTLGAFVSEGLINVDGRKITILNEDELKNISRKG